MTPTQFAILQGKIATWRWISESGTSGPKDYNLQAAESLTAALVERADLLAALKELAEFYRGVCSNLPMGMMSASDVEADLKRAVAAIARAEAT